jgi:hypothetical protein
MNDSNKIKNLKANFLKTLESSQEILNFNLGKDRASKIIRSFIIDSEFLSLGDQIVYFEDDSRFKKLSEQDKDFLDLHEWAKNFKALNSTEINSDKDIKKFKEYKIKYYEKFFEENFIDKDQAKLIIEALEKIKYEKTLPDETDEKLPNSERALQTENEKTARLAKIIDDFQELEWKKKDLVTDFVLISQGYKTAKFKTPQELMDRLYPNSNYPNPKKESKIHKKLFDVYVDELFELALKEIKKDKEIVCENESPEKKSPEEKMKFLEEVIESKKTKQEENKQKMQIQSFIKSLEDIPLIAGVNGFATLRTNILEEKRDEKDFEEISKKNAENINELYKLVKNQEKNSKKFSLEKLPNELFKIMQQNKNFEALVSCLSFGLLAGRKVSSDELQKSSECHKKDVPELQISTEEKINLIKSFIEKMKNRPSVEAIVSDYNTLFSMLLVEKAKNLFDHRKNSPSASGR